MKSSVTVGILVQLPVPIVWEYWVSPKHIINWNFASPDWHCPSAKNDLRPGGKFSWRMEAKDGSMDFDFNGTYNKIELNNLIEYTLDDGRLVKINFEESGNYTKVIQVFEI